MKTNSISVAPLRKWNSFSVFFSPLFPPTSVVNLTESMRVREWFKWGKSRLWDWNKRISPLLRSSKLLFHSTFQWGHWYVEERKCLQNIVFVTDDKWECNQFSKFQFPIFSLFTVYLKSFQLFTCHLKVFQFRERCMQSAFNLPYAVMEVRSHSCRQQSRPEKTREMTSFLKIFCLLS